MATISRSREYREQAERLLQQALAAKTAEAHRELRALALFYTALADQAERVAAQQHRQQQGKPQT